MISPLSPARRPARIALAALIALAVAAGCKKKPVPATEEVVPDPNPMAGVPNRPVPTIDNEGLPIGNDLDSVLVRLNVRYQRGDFHLYQLELMNLRAHKNSARRAEVFRTLRAQAGTPGAQPQIGTVPFAAWQEAMTWTTKDDTPELSKMLRAEAVEQRQSDLFTRLETFKDSRCAEAVAPFLAVPARRNRAEMLLRDLDSTAEKHVLPYLAAGQDKETRVAALQVVAEVGTAESARIVETMTRDSDLLVNHHAKIVFGKLSQRFGTQQDLSAVVAALKAGIANADAVAINDNSTQLDKAYRPDHPKRAEIFKGLIECCKVPDPKGYGKRAAFVGAMKWSSAADIGTLCELLVSSGGESVVFLKLKEYKSAQAAPTVAAYLALPLKSSEAADVLKAIGAAAEKSVMPYALKAAPNGVEIPSATRLAAINLLGDIGTRESVPLLQQLTADATVKPAASGALTKIANRVR